MRAEFDAVRSVSARFLVAADHLTPTETVVLRGDRYSVIEDRRREPDRVREHPGPSMTAAELEGRRVRAAKSQSLLREVNERIEELSSARSASIFEELRLDKEIDLACECMDEACTECVTLSVREYEAVRSDSNTFSVKPGHEVPEVEEVVREQPNYVVVSKVGAGAPVAEKLDARRRPQA